MLSKGRATSKMDLGNVGDGLMGIGELGGDGFLTRTEERERGDLGEVVTGDTVPPSAEWEMSEGEGGEAWRPKSGQTSSSEEAYGETLGSLIGVIWRNMSSGSRVGKRGSYEVGLQLGGDRSSPGVPALTLSGELECSIS